ncbi:MAG: hypothetical protein ABFD89_09160 [Bryobacteraceae bacterium]
MLKDTDYLTYTFTDPELLELAREQSRVIQEKGVLEKKKSELAKSLGGEIEGKQSRIDKIAECIRSGYEWRDVEIEVRLDSPENGKAEIVRLDTGEVYKTRPMTPDELQLKLDIGMIGMSAESHDDQTAA